MSLTPEQLKAALAYDPATGIFSWKIKPNGRVLAGARAGSLHHRGYRRIVFGRHWLAEHRIAWLFKTGDWPTEEIDHIDGNRSNNAAANLRLATKSQNQSNRGANKNSSHGFKGVKRHQKGRLKTGKWVACITKDRKRYSLGIFDTPEAAHAAYVAAAERLHGEFARGA